MLYTMWELGGRVGVEFCKSARSGPFPPTFGDVVVRGEKIPVHLKHELSLWGAGKGHDALNNADLALAWFPAIPPAASGPEFVSLDQLVHPLVLRAPPICRGHPDSSAA